MIQKKPRDMHKAQRGAPDRQVSVGKAELLVELIHTAAGVNELLLAGEKGVALRADFDLDILFGRPGGDDLSAGALDGCLIILGMDPVLHAVHLFLPCHFYSASYSTTVSLKMQALFPRNYCCQNV